MRGDGPEEFHVILLDNGRTRILHDKEAQQTLKCIRCGACQNTCPVYRQTGGHAYGSVYAGPIGAILTPQLFNLEQGASLPYASSLCGACYEVCPVAINIPEVLIHLRGRSGEERASDINGQVWGMESRDAGSCADLYEWRPACPGSAPGPRGPDAVCQGGWIHSPAAVHC